MAVNAVMSCSKVLLRVEFRHVYNLTRVLGLTGWNNSIEKSCSPRRCRHTRRLYTSARNGITATPPVASSATSAGGGGHSDLGSDAANTTRLTSQWMSEGTLLKPTPASPETGAVTVEYSRGLPVITVPLPSRKERCRFTLRPISHTVGDFQNMLAREDRGIDRVTVTTLDDIRIASSNTIESLMENDFRLVINDSVFEVVTPRQERLSQEEVRQLSDVRNLVNQLYEALNVGEHQLQKERELFTQLEELKEQLEPLEMKRLALCRLSEKRTTVLTWVGLGMMSVQFGILARLTWWEYSWDIMEPVTYFVTYGTAMAAYAYFVLTKQEYILPDVKDRQFLITFHKKAKKLGLDVHRYNELKDGIARIENDLRRLRDPLQIHLPPAHLQESSPFGNLTDKHGSPILSPFARAHEQIRNLLKRKS